MLRSHKKSHFRHLIFHCSNCSFESKEYSTLQEHLQIEGHEIYLDDNIEEFLREYSQGHVIHMNSTNTTKTAVRRKKSHKYSTSPVSPSSMHCQRRSSASSLDSSVDTFTSVPAVEHVLPTTLACTLCSSACLHRQRSISSGISQQCNSRHVNQTQRSIQWQYWLE
jgi:hypothetical protein